MLNTKVLYYKIKKEHFSLYKLKLLAIKYFATEKNEDKK